ncbi:MAG: T9SS type A sorting domain-containing protein [Ignavibacteria bacterium]|nr:T9SS type A sorting domain-containing protein [Ignavibacteria bacterium]
MKKTVKLLFTFLLVVFVANFAKAQLDPLTFTVRTMNFKYYDDLGNLLDPNNYLNNVAKFEFDLCIQQTNTPANDAEIMRFALGQYYWNLNVGAGFPGDTTGFLGYASVVYKPLSTTFSNPNAIPTSPTFLAKNAATDILSPDGYPVGTARSSIRMNSNIALGSSSDVQVSGVYPGTRVGTYIVTKKVTAVNPSPFFPDVYAHMRYRQGPLNVNSSNPFTKIFAYNGLGGLSTEVTYKGTYLIDTTGGGAFPVELASFVATTNRNIVNLNWSTASESNNSGFDIERKAVNATEWTKVGNVAGNGTVSEARNYTFSDRASTGRFNYRLKQIDYNGNFEYFNLSSEVEVGIPAKFDMSQNYPNPFNPSTKINYDLPKDGQVSITLFDMTGRQVATIVNEAKTAGYYTVQFNASNLSSGMYFYRIAASDFVSTKKMVLIK